ncbi:poly(ADP-ribose) glycohydrolase ARH3 [Micromonospora sp. Llam0]|uniref:ADP-ribosylglycohydrolase family protein n=1 Tax=Micromonospora sp. Llam0 TaxID=2485143 RepID=UPI000F474529|nr:ADP-ribosylglycohydrolase family protein [Micromonospora sp. Llam0]ROO63273.1 poly(ADP-ribose) glycohydrolase ARH3 [Micromonospora sp. Llam0]
MAFREDEPVSPATPASGLDLPASGPDPWSLRVRGAILLSACADGLGAPFEGVTAVDEAAVDHLLETPPQLRWTDDTALTLALAEHLVRRGGDVDQDQLAAAFAAEWSARPDLGYGAGVAEQFGRIVAGESWVATSRGAFGGAGSYGNGAAMRVAPVGLLPGLPLAEVARRARRTAEITHAHPLAQDGAVAQAVAVAVAARSRQDTPIDADLLIAAVAAQLQTPQFRAALSIVRALARRRATPAEIAEAVGNGVAAVESVPAALAVFLAGPQRPHDVVRSAIRVGGDTDTIAAMAAAVCGARCGEQGLPVLWGLRVADTRRLWHVASALAAVTPGGPVDGS